MGLGKWIMSNFSGVHVSFCGMGFGGVNYGVCGPMITLLVQQDQKRSVLYTKSLILYQKKPDSYEKSPVLDYTCPTFCLNSLMVLQKSSAFIQKQTYSCAVDSVETTRSSIADCMCSVIQSNPPISI